MSEYGGYGGPGESLRVGSGVQTAPRYGYPTDIPQVLASVPDMEAEPNGLVERPPRASHAGQNRDLLSPRLVGVISAIVLLSGAIGFTLGRAGRSDPSPGTEAWAPPPPAADAPEAPAWPGGSVVGAPSQPLGPTPVAVDPESLSRGFETAPVASPLAGSEARPQGGLVPLAPPPRYAAQPGSAPTYSPYQPGSTNAGPAIPAQGLAGDADRFANPYARALASGQIGTPAVPDYSGVAPSNYAGANQSMRLDAAGSQGQGFGAVAANPEGYALPSDPRVALRSTQDPIPTPSPPPGVSNDYYRGTPAGGSGGAYPPAGSYRGQPYPPEGSYRGQPYPPEGSYRGTPYPQNSSGTNPAVVHPAVPAVPAGWPAAPAAGGYASPGVQGNPPAYAAPGAPSGYAAPQGETPYYYGQQ